MLESLLYPLLSAYLGHYVKDLQKEQLRVGLWRGVVRLQKVELRLEAFEYLDLPCSVLSATAGLLELQASPPLTRSVQFL